MIEIALPFSFLFAILVTDAAIMLVIKMSLYVQAGLYDMSFDP